MDENLTKIVWREWYNEAAVKQLEAMGTLPRYETALDTRWMDGAEVAAAVAEAANKDDFEAFMKGGEMVIIEPEEFAGAYNIEVEYEPVFLGYERE